MLNLTISQQQFITRFTEQMATQEIIEDLMLMYSAYVEDVSNLDKFDISTETFLDIQSKLYTVQSVLQLVAVIHDAAPV
jgi:hypothetical protein